MTESEYVSTVLDRMLRIAPLIQNINGLALSEDLFRQLLAQSNSTGIEIVGSEIADRNVSFIFDLLGLDLNANAAELFARNVLQRWGWFRIESGYVGTSREIKLFHNYGLKWSLFLKAYMSTLYEIVNEKSEVFLSEKIVKIRIMEMATQNYMDVIQGNG